MRKMALRLTPDGSVQHYAPPRFARNFTMGGGYNNLPYLQSAAPPRPLNSSA